MKRKRYRKCTIHSEFPCRASSFVKNWSGKGVHYLNKMERDGKKWHSNLGKQMAITFVQSQWADKQSRDLWWKTCNSQQSLSYLFSLINLKTNWKHICVCTRVQMLDTTNCNIDFPKPWHWAHLHILYLFPNVCDTWMRSLQMQRCRHSRPSVLHFSSGDLDGRICRLWVASEMLAA